MSSCRAVAVPIALSAIMQACQDGVLQRIKGMSTCVCTFIRLKSLTSSPRHDLQLDLDPHQPHLHFGEDAYGKFNYTGIR